MIITSFLSTNNVRRFFLQNFKWLKATKHIYKNFVIGSMISMAAINELLTNNTRDTNNYADSKEYTKIYWLFLIGK